jgi:hypothetical protein
MLNAQTKTMKKIIVIFLIATVFCTCSKEKNAPANVQNAKSAIGTTALSNSTAQSFSDTSSQNSITQKKKVVKIKYPKPRKR